MTIDPVWHDSCSSARVRLSPRFLTASIVGLLSLGPCVDAVGAQASSDRTTTGASAALSMRLADRVGSPLALLSTRTDAAGAERGGAAKAPLGLDPLGRLTDRGLGRMVRMAAHLDPTESALSSWNTMSKLLGTAEGEIEIALVALLPQAQGPSLPLLIARVELGEAGREGLVAALKSGQFAERHRMVEVAGSDGGKTAVQTYGLKGSERRVGAFFELALVGDQLFLSNQASALTEVLEFGSPDPAPDSIGRDQNAQRLLRELGDADVRLIVDWERVRGRIESLLTPGPSLSLDALGLDTATRLAVGVHAAEDGLESCLVLDQPGGPSGLFASTERSSPKELSKSLTGDSIATAVLAVDFGGLLRADGPAGYLGFHRHASSCSQSVGIDFERAVLPNLGRRAACEVHWLGDSRERAGVALAFQARSKRGARRLVDAVKDGLASLKEPMQSETTRGVGETHHMPARGVSFGARGDRFVLGLDNGVIGSMDAPTRAPKRDALSRAQIEDLLERALPKAARKRSTTRRTIGAFLLRPGAFEGAFAHAGLLSVDPTMVRLDCFTPDD